MKPGDVILTTHVTAVDPIAGAQLNYKAGKDKFFVFIFLGAETRTGEPLDPIKALNELGWELAKERGGE